MTKESFSEDLREVTEQLRQYVETQVEYYKLQAFKTVAKSGSLLPYVLIAASLGFFILLFLSVALAFVLADEFNSLWLGFLLVGGGYAFFLILWLILGRNLIGNWIIRKLSDLFYEKKKENE